MDEETVFEIVNHERRESFDNSEYTHAGFAATVQHHTDNGDEQERHAIMVGDDVIVIEKTDE